MTEREQDLEQPYGIATYQVKESDLDMYGHVNYKSFVHIFEPGQDQFMDERGVGFKTIEERYGLRSFVKAFAITYEGQLFANQKAEIRTIIDRLGNTSIGYKQQLFVDNRRIAVFGMTVVLVNQDGNPTAIPEELRQKLGTENPQL